MQRDIITLNNIVQDDMGYEEMEETAEDIFQWVEDSNFITNSM